MLSESERSLIRKLAIVGAFLLTISGLAGGTALVISRNKAKQAQIAAQLKEQKHLADQKKIREMVSMCAFSNVSDEEQAEIDRCGDDIEAARSAIDRLLTKRITFWSAAVKDETERMTDIVRAKHNSRYWDSELEAVYNEAAEKISGRYQRARREMETFKAKREQLKCA